MKKVLIIGSGCSGLTASIYVARASFRPLLIEGYKLGGQLIDTNNIENFPGFPNNISGYCLINKMKKQSLSFGVRFLDSVVLSINFKSYVKKIYLNNRIQFNCFYVLVATGASNRFLNVYGEKKFYCNGISTCATCDGFLTKDKTVVIIGAGDSACEEALFLSKIARRVIVLCRKNRMRASYFLKKKALLNKKVFFIWNFEVKNIYKLNSYFQITCKHTLKKNIKIKLLNVSFIFLAVGHIPNTLNFKYFLKLNEHSMFKSTSDVKNYGLLKKNGVYLSGDCIDNLYKQAVTASGAGCRSALDLIRDINQLFK